MNSFIYKVLGLLALFAVAFYGYFLITADRCKGCGCIHKCGFTNQELIQNVEFTVTCNDYCRDCAYEKFGKIGLIYGIAE